MTAASPSINGYVLLGDPAWLEPSIRSWYPIAGRIFAIYDRQGLSWSGAALPVDECIARLKAIDSDNKVVLVPGDFSDPSRPPEVGETTQRSLGLNAAGEDADWVLQLDTDELVPDRQRLLDSLRRADLRGFQALDFPARYLYAEVRPGLFVEASTRFLRYASGFPGAKALASGAKLSFCRETDAERWRVDIRRTNADPYRAADSPVHEVVRPCQALLHFSWTRTDSEMELRSRFHGHAHRIEWDRELAHWRAAKARPRRFVLSHVTRRGPRHYRLSRLPYTQKLFGPLGSHSP